MTIPDSPAQFSHLPRYISVNDQVVTADILPKPIFKCTVHGSEPLIKLFQCCEKTKLWKQSLKGFFFFK